MEFDGNDILWNHFILAAALTRVAGRVAERAMRDDEECRPAFRYADTHSGCGRLPRPARLTAALETLPGSAWASHVDAAAGDYAGSWLLAGRVVAGLDAADFEADINDIDCALIETAKGRREAGWVRFWSYDWFLFLRNRLSMEPRPHLVFIDPPADDPRGPNYAIDAALLLDTLGLPYLVTYPVDAEGAVPQEAIDQIGRSGLELVGAGPGRGVLVGGGAETVVLDILSDLRLLAQALGGELQVRLPRPPVDDYCI